MIVAEYGVSERALRQDFMNKYIIGLLIVVATTALAISLLFRGKTQESHVRAVPVTAALSSGDIARLKTVERQKVVIRMTKTGFEPSEIEILQGEVVMFKNDDKKDRWPASDIHPSHGVYPEFDPKRKIVPSGSWRFTFYKAGEWKFHDHLFSQFTGRVIVKGKNVSKTQLEKLSLPIANSSSTSILDKMNIMSVSKNEGELTGLIKAYGPRIIMGKLLKDSGGGSVIDCHQEAHLIGRIAYELFGVGAFRDGNASCHSGYYHGAMEQFLAEKGTVDFSKNVASICDIFDTYFGRFECIHGVGHGVLAYENYDLPQAIKTCNFFESDYNKSSCYGGAFMENVVTGQGFGAKGAHATIWLNKDPHFPCNGISQEFSVQFQCYQMQTSWMLTLNKYDFDAVASECLNARNDMISVCFKSLGRDAAGHSLRDPQKISKICEKIQKEKDYYDQCIIGATNVIVDFWGSDMGDYSVGLCKTLPDEGKKPCYDTVYSRLFDVFNLQEERKGVCSKFEQEYQGVCGTL